MRMFLIAAVTTIAAFPAMAQTAPQSGVSTTLKASATVATEKVAYRCGWRRGYRICRWVGLPYYNDYYGAALRAAASSVPTP